MRCGAMWSSWLNALAMENGENFSQVLQEGLRQCLAV